MSLLISQVITHAANPSGRIETHVDVLAGEQLAHNITRMLCLLAVATGVSTSKCLHTIARGLEAVTGSNGDGGGVVFYRSRHRGARDGGGGIATGLRGGFTRLTGSVSQGVRLGGVVLGLFRVLSF